MKRFLALLLLALWTVPSRADNIDYRSLLLQWFTTNNPSPKYVGLNTNAGGGLSNYFYRSITGPVSSNFISNVSSNAGFWRTNAAYAHGISNLYSGPVVIGDPQKAGGDPNSILVVSRIVGSDDTSTGDALFGYLQFSTDVSGNTTFFGGDNNTLTIQSDGNLYFNGGTRYDFQNGSPMYGNGTSLTNLNGTNIDIVYDGGLTASSNGVHRVTVSINTNAVLSLATNVVNNNSSPQVWTNDNGLVHPVSNTVPVQIGLNSSGAGNPPGGGVVSTLFIEGDSTIPVGNQLIYGNGGFPLVGIANGDQAQLSNSQNAELWAYNQNKAGMLGYGVVGYSYAGFAGSTNVGVAGSVERSHGNASPSTGGYFELTDDENTDVLIENSVIILDNKTTGAPLLTARTNGIKVFKVDGTGNLDTINKVRYQWPGTNLTSGQVFASDGGTPQQIYGATLVNGVTGGTTNVVTTNTPAGVTNFVNSQITNQIPNFIRGRTNYMAFFSPNTNTVAASIMFQTNGTTDLGIRNGDNPDGSLAVGLKIYGHQVSDAARDWLDLNWNVASGDYEIMTDKGASGTARTLTFGTGGVRRWDINTSGHLLPIANNSYDIGASSDGIRNLFVEGSVEFDQVGSPSLTQVGTSSGSGSGIYFAGTRIGFANQAGAVDAFRIEAGTVTPPSKTIVDIGPSILAAGSAVGSRNVWLGADPVNTGNRWQVGTNNTAATAQPAANQIVGTVGNGNTRLGGDLGVYGGISTGSGTNGSLILGTAEGGASASTQNTLKIRAYWAPEPTTLTESTATIVCTVSNITTGKKGTVYVTATTVADDGTQQQTVGEKFAVSFGNVSGTVGTPVVSASSPTATFTSSGTLTTAWTAVVNANSIDIKNSAVSSLTQTTLNTRWHIEIDGDFVPHIYDVGFRHL